MSELGGGRASNGGARTAGPVPVPTGTPTGLKTPRDIMRNRHEREARRQEEAKMEEQRKLQQVDDRRKSAERRATAATGEPRYSATSSQYTQDASAQQPGAGYSGSRLSGSGHVASGSDYGVPTGRTVVGGDSGYVSGRTATGGGDSGYVSGSRRHTSGPSVSQDQPRPAQQATASSSRRTASQPAATMPRQPAAPPSQQQAAGVPPSIPQAPDKAQSAAGATADGGIGGRSSNFPHAFERWEQLSSHWEGLTSYWLRKLETDAEEIQRGVPSASAMSRQITDLSAAGANLFHAVVELQRLRASSERKFQRWFFETRGDTERNQEVRAQLEQQLQLERSERQKAANARVESDIAAENARREVAEMRRELMISKEEARRAWEELGRRNQESLEIAESLKSGRVTLVSGVQVTPYFGGPSRTGSASQRPGTRDGPQYGGVAHAGAAGLQSPGDDEDYYQEESPTNTDPFTENKPPLHHEPGVSSLAAGTYQPYPVGSQAGSSTSGHRGVPPSQMDVPRSMQQHGAQPMSPQEGQRFYQHEPQDTSFLHSPPPSRGGPVAQASQASAVPQEVRSQGSYVGSVSESEFVIEPSGDFQQDEQGRRIPFRRNAAPASESDEYDTEADVRREGELAAHYGAAQGSVPEAPTVPATSAQAMASYTPPTSGAAGGQQPGSGPDYEGSGYGTWEPLARHHHPTRLSDVLEEEEERSSRRTAE